MPRPSRHSGVEANASEYDDALDSIVSHSVDRDRGIVTFETQRSSDQTTRRVQEIVVHRANQAKVIEYWKTFNKPREETIDTTAFCIFDILKHQPGNPTAKPPQEPSLYIHWVGYTPDKKSSTWEPVDKMLETQDAQIVLDYIKRKGLTPQLVKKTSSPLASDSTGGRARTPAPKTTGARTPAPKTTGTRRGRTPATAGPSTSPQRKRENASPTQAPAAKRRHSSPGRLRSTGKPATGTTTVEERDVKPALGGGPGRRKRSTAAADADRVEAPAPGAVGHKRRAAAAEPEQLHRFELVISHQTSENIQKLLSFANSLPEPPQLPPNTQYVFKHGISRPREMS